MKKLKELKLGSAPLELSDVLDVAVRGRKVSLSPQAIAKVKRAHAFLRGEIADGKIMYGVNTGFGLLSNVKIPPQDIQALQVNILRSHACGVGPAMGDAIVRAMLLLRASTLTIGHSGVSIGVVQQLLALLNRGVCPVVPQQGSVGASGDLAPLSHLALVLIGEGRARINGKEMSGAQALKKVSLKPLALGPKEGLALINGTQFMTAIGTLALLEAESLCDIADLAGAMSLEAMQGTNTAFEPEIHSVRPHPGQVFVAKQVRSILTSAKGGPKKSEIARSHINCDKVQDPYSLRCIPQVHGATRDVLRFVREVLEREINSVTDNPLVFPTAGKVLSGGNFHGQIVAMAMDALAIAVAELASISEQRVEKLINPAISGLPAFLTNQGGLHSGFMIVQVAAASIVSENKTLCHPASVDSIPTSADKEDHVSMGAWAARKAQRVVVNTRRVLAMELLSAAQGIEFQRPHRSSLVIEAAHAAIRREVPKVTGDREFHRDFAKIEKLMQSDQLNRCLDLIR